MNRGVKSQTGERTALKYQLDLARETLLKLRTMNDTQTSETSRTLISPEKQKHEEHKRRDVSNEYFTERRFDGNTLSEDNANGVHNEQPARAHRGEISDKRKHDSHKEEKHERLVQALGLKLSELEDSFKIALLKYFDQVEDQKEELINGFELMQEQLLKHEQHCFMMGIEKTHDLQNTSQHDLRILQTELQRAMGAQRACAEDNSRLREELRAHQYQVAMGELPEREQTDEVVKLQNKVAVQEKICDAYTKDVAVKCDEIQSLKAEKTNLANELRAVYDELGEVETLQTKREEQRGKLGKELESSKETVRYLQSQLRAASEEKLHLLSRIEELNCHSGENSERFEDVETCLQEVNANCIGFKQELVVQEKRVKELENEKDIMGKDNIDLRTALQQSQNTVNALRRDRENADLELSKVKQKNLDMKIKSDKEQNKMFELQQELARAKGKMSALESNSEEMRSKEENAKEEIKRGESKLEELREELHSSRNKVESVQNDLEKCENQRNKLYNETISLQGKIMQLEKTNADLRVEKAELQRDFSHASKKLPKLEQIYSKLEKENEQLLNDFQESKEKCTQLGKDLGKERAHRSKLQTKVTLLAESLQTSEKQLKEAQTELLKLHNCQDELSDKFLKSETESKYLKAVNKSLEQQIDKLRGNMRETDIENEVMKRDMKRLEKELKDRDAKKKALLQSNDLRDSYQPRNHNDNTEPELISNTQPNRSSFDVEDGRPVGMQNARELSAVIPVLERENKELRNRERDLMVQLMEKDRDSYALAVETGNNKLNSERQEDKIGKLMNEIENLKGDAIKRKKERDTEREKVKRMKTEKENFEKNRKDIGTSTDITVDVKSDASMFEVVVPVIVEQQQACDTSPAGTFRDQEMEDIANKLNAIANENKILKEREETLKNDIQQLESEYKALKDSEAKLRRDNKEKEVENSCLKDSEETLRQQTQKKEEEYKALKDKAKTLRKHLEETKGENTALKDRETTLKTDLQKLQKAEKELKFENETLKESMSDDASKLAVEKNLKRKLSELESTLEDYNTEVKNVRQQKKGIQKELVEAKEKLNLLEDTCDVLKKENEQSRANENSLRQKIRELEISFEDAEVSMKEMQKRKEKIESDMTDAENKIDALENSYKERTQENEQLQENELKLKQAIRELKGDLEDSRAELESVLKLRNKQVKEIDDIMSKTGMMEGDYEALREENDKLKDKENKLKKSVQQQEDDLADVQMKLRNASKEKEALGKELQEMNEVVKKMKDKYELLETEKDGLREKEGALRKANKELEGIIEDLTLELHNIENVKRTKEEELKECKRALQLLENKYQLLEQENERLRAHEEEERDRSDLQLENDTLNTNLQAAHESILELETAYQVAQDNSQQFEEMNDEANRKIKELETERSTAKDDVQRLEKACDVANERVKELEKEVNDIKKKGDDLEMQVKYVKEEMENAVEEKTKTEEQLAITEENLADMEIEVHNLHEAQEAMFDEVDALKEQAQDLEKRNKTLKEQKRAVEEELDEAHDKITELRTKLKNKEEEVEIMEDEMQSLQANVRFPIQEEEENALDVTESEELREELMAMSKKVWELEASNETYQKDIEDIETSLIAGNEKVTELENELDSISREYADIQGQFEDVNNKLKLAKSERQAAEQRTTEQREMCNTYRKTLSERDDNIREMKQLRDSLEESVQALKRDVNTKDNSLRTLNDKLSAQEEEFVKTTKALKELEAVHKNCEQLAKVRVEQLSSSAPGSKGKSSSSPYHSKLNSLHGDIHSNSIQVGGLSEKLSSAQQKMINLENELKKDLRKFERKHNGYSSDNWEDYDRPRRRRSYDYESELDELRAPRRDNERRSSDSPLSTPTMSRRSYKPRDQVKDNRSNGRRLPDEPTESESRPTSGDSVKNRLTIPISDPFGNGTDVFEDDSELDSEASDWIKNNPFDIDADSVFSISQDDSLNASVNNETKLNTNQVASMNISDWNTDGFSSSLEDNTEELIIPEKKAEASKQENEPVKDKTQQKEQLPVLPDDFFIDQKSSQNNFQSNDPFFDLDPFSPTAHEHDDEESWAQVTSTTASPWSVHSDDVSSLGLSRDSDDDSGIPVGSQALMQYYVEVSDPETLIYLSSDNESLTEGGERKEKPQVPPKPKKIILDSKKLENLDLSVDIQEHTGDESQWSPGTDRVSQLVKSFEKSKQSWL